jgi:5'-nucleotidase
VTTAEGLFLPAFSIRVFDGVPVAVIGMTLEATPFVTVPSGVADLTFLDEAATVNALVPQLQDWGIETIVVVVHEGGRQEDGGPNDCNNLSGNIIDIANSLDDAVDVLVTGHTHAAYNCNINNKVVTSAGSAGRLLTRIDLSLNASTRDAVVETVENQLVDHTIEPDAAVAAIVDETRTLVDAQAGSVIGTLAGSLSRNGDGTGQSTLGFVIADSQLAATQAAGAQIAFMNDGGIRADLPSGDITYGQAFAVQPFGNDLVTMTLTGVQLHALLDAQFAFGGFNVLLPSASLRYQIAPLAAGGVAIVAGSILFDGVPLDLNASYRVTVNVFLSEGGDGQQLFIEGTDRVVGGLDVDAFVDYVSSSSPLPVPSLDRILFPE